jgi:hypothetical protein
MIAWQDLAQRANADPEFRYAARHWNATLRLDLGERSQRLRIADGKLVDVSPCAAGAPCDLFVSAPESDWRELLADVPKPFYQDLYGAQSHHQVRLPEDQTAYAAYYPALRRLLRAMSECRS